MIRVVYDCNVILAAIGWAGTARLCLKLAARRRVVLCVTESVLAEYEAVIPEDLSALARQAGIVTTSLCSIFTLVAEIASLIV